MKKILLPLILGLLLSGCLAKAKESDFFKHETLFRNGDHFKFSLWGYQNPSEESYQKTQEQDWWGIPIPYRPEK